ncbi:hypothetical protein HMPREF0322_04218 [Desulfitobacterium hafniense DP7]|uniref:Uncharacterized protein n=1 Tax=Desulfitobacterium hafniense DP7 TaxID=537010 RepID=G9XTB2_DESHA|nr:hypothetical protein HMPREF0322_04218 [Desulfitobacterium hafniense DP7]
MFTVTPCFSLLSFEHLYYSAVFLYLGPLGRPYAGFTGAIRLYSTVHMKLPKNKEC